jgi:long-chain acyl-CoA synthetase
MNDIELSELLKSLPDSVTGVIKPWSDRSPDRLALVEASGSWTYRQLDAVIAQTRSWLRDSGVRPGDRVMIVCENCRPLVAIFLAATGIDAWPVFANARLSAREIDDICDHCGARRVIYTTAVSHHATQHAKRHGAVIAEAAGLGPIGFGPLNENVQPEPIGENRADRVAALIYTSGTTGLPKGVVLTHRNLLFCAAISAKIRSLAPDDRLYGVLPMSHAVGLSVVLLGTLLSGATLYLAPRFDPVAALASLERDKLTVVLGVPSMFGLLVEYTKMKGIATLKFPALRIISSSGAALQPAVKSAVEKLFGMPLYNGYGVTECSPNIAQASVEDPRADTSVGQVFPGIEVKFIGAEGKPVPEGEVGELWVRGPNVMKGYYRAPEETAAAIDADGWFNTRDLARLENGNLFIVGRTKELIVRYGMNVYPAEVEAVLNTHPGVVRSAVIGRNVQGMEGGEEEVIAFVQLSLNSPATIAELAKHAAVNLAPYKQPSQIILVPEMPVTLTGKVKKDELAKMAPSNEQPK